jgi:tRNA pseudouridine38-40 synthase
VTTERVLKLTIEYDGTEFHGWQRQPGARTVEGAIEDALAELIPGGADIQGASRTDQGVHAAGQAASARVLSPIPTARFARALNGRLPPDVRVRDVEEAPPGFNARFAAVAKHYRYWIDRRPISGVFTRRYALHVPQPLDIDAMREAAAHFPGEHDFAAYRCVSDGPPRTSVRTVHAVEVTEEAGGDYLAIDVIGRSFLYKMVRTMAGTLLDVGAGRLSPLQVAESLRRGGRGAAGPTAPPHGLCLISVSYPGSPPVDGAWSRLAVPGLSGGAPPPGEGRTPGGPPGPRGSLIDFGAASG